ncbi:hypothetical protein [Patulibacter minatonensis]|uniref:hypothetical protein n=1 Tax=Patulibacter minatonensis TaxID=298163 RepID=UPI000479E3D8|nr:hypothetical protein [Patulibacter minatonensis]
MTDQPADPDDRTSPAEDGPAARAAHAGREAAERRRGVVQLVGSLLVALAIAGGTVAAVTSKLGTTSVAALEAREERAKQAEDVREERAKDREDAAKDRRKAREDAATDRGRD